MIFFLSGVAPNLQIHKSQIQLSNPNMMYPILSQKQYKLETQQNKKQQPFSTLGIGEGALLKKELLKECHKTSQLIQIANQMQKKFPKKRKRSQQHISSAKTKNKKKSRAVSSHSTKKIPSKTPKRQKTSSSSSTSTESSSTTSSTASSDSSQT